MKTINRLKQFIDEKGISLNAFDASIGAANGYIGKTIKNEASIGSDVLEKIFSVYPDLDPIWLLTGKKKGNSPIEKQGFNINSPEFRALAHTLKQGFASQNASPTASPTHKKTGKNVSYQPSESTENISFAAEPHVPYGTPASDEENTRNAVIVALLRHIKELL